MGIVGTNKKEEVWATRDGAQIALIYLGIQWSMGQERFAIRK
jgi:hypothetical protein